MRWVSVKLDRVFCLRGGGEMILYHPFTGQRLIEYARELPALMQQGASLSDVRADVLQRTIMEPQQWIEAYAYGAYDGDQLIASALFFVSDLALWPENNARLTGEITGLFVARAYRRQRVATRILNRFLFIGQSKYLDRCTLEAETPKVHALCRSLGFAVNESGHACCFEFARQRRTFRVVK